MPNMQEMRKIIAEADRKKIEAMVEGLDHDKESLKRELDGSKRMVGILVDKLGGHVEIPEAELVSKDFVLTVGTDPVDGDTVIESKAVDQEPAPMTTEEGVAL